MGPRHRLNAGSTQPDPGRRWIAANSRQGARSISSNFRGARSRQPRHRQPGRCRFGRASCPRAADADAGDEAAQGRFAEGNHYDLWQVGTPSEDSSRVHLARRPSCRSAPRNGPGIGENRSRFVECEKNRFFFFFFPFSRPPGIPVSSGRIKQ